MTKYDLIMVIARLQDLVGKAKSLHGNDRNLNGFEKGQDALEEAFQLCIDTLSHFPPINYKGNPK